MKILIIGGSGFIGSHLAALVRVPESMAKPGECVDINMHGLLNVLEEGLARTREFFKTTK